MKRIQNILLTTVLTGLSVSACEFTIINDGKSGYSKIYIAFNEHLADVVSEIILRTSPGKEDSKEHGSVTKNNFAISQHDQGKTPFTKWFDVFVPYNKKNNQFKRLYRVKMNYCANDNTMTLSQIKQKTINMKRFSILDYTVPSQAARSHTHCKPHASGHEHREAYEKNTTLSNPGISQPEVLVRPFGDKELLP
jgi:hypothetical protein